MAIESDLESWEELEDEILRIRTQTSLKRQARSARVGVKEFKL